MQCLDAPGPFQTTLTRLLLKFALVLGILLFCYLLVLVRTFYYSLLRRTYRCHGNWEQAQPRFDFAICPTGRARVIDEIPRKESLANAKCAEENKKGDAKLLRGGFFFLPPQSMRGGGES